MLGRVLVLMTTLFGLAGGTAAASGPPLDWASLNLTSIDGTPMPPETFRGKVVMIVNTASLCGFTKQYSGLQTLWETYREQGLVVLGLPSNDFGGQEPHGEAEIKTFCEANFGIDFPMTEKIKVTGDDPHPIYRWARAQAGAMGAPRWNFHKYVIGRDGAFVDWFSSLTGPNSDRVIRAVEKALAK